MEKDFDKYIKYMPNWLLYSLRNIDIISLHNRKCLNDEIINRKENEYITSNKFFLNDWKKLERIFNLLQPVEMIKGHDMDDRYDDIKCIKSTQVKSPLYIHANHVQFNNLSDIATQGPLEHTSNNFWMMIKEHNITHIAMLTDFYENDIEKCSTYFPLIIGTKMNFYYDTLTVQLNEKETLNNITKYILQINYDGDNPRYVTHIQYFGWKDGKAPSSFEEFDSYMNYFEDKYPTVVHCSAGVGRSGVWLIYRAVVNIFKKWFDDGANTDLDISLIDMILHGRKQRHIIVQTRIQYDFICHALGWKFWDMFQKKMKI